MTNRKNIALVFEFKKKDITLYGFEHALLKYQLNFVLILN
jgi:hypothetical protein